MNLISCTGCGVLYDADYIDFPEDIYKDDGYGGEMIDDTKATYDKYEGGFYRLYKCGFCGTAIQSKKKVW